MITDQEIVLEKIDFQSGPGTLTELSLAAAEKLGVDEVKGVVFASFSNPERFPAMSVRIASKLGLGSDVIALDLALACSAYPYALYVAGKIAADVKGRVLVVDGDVQSQFVNPNDHATGNIFTDAVSATIISVDERGVSNFDFHSIYSEALKCTSSGPIQMDGFKVFSFVATEVNSWLRRFVTSSKCEGDFAFVPHQANPYMIRQLAKSLELEPQLKMLPPEFKNPGSSSIALTLKHCDVHGRALLAGFGAGYSAAFATVTVR